VSGSPDDPLLEGLAGVDGPDPALAARRARAAALVATHLGPLLRPDGIRTSPLGAGWSSDVDAHVRTLPGPAELLDLGWVPLGALLERLGSPGVERWAVVEDGEVLSAVDLHLGPPPGAVDAVLDRIRRRREVRPREVLELRALQERGAGLPDGDAALGLAAAVERELGGDALRRWRPSGSPPRLPARPLRALPPRLRSKLRRRRVVVALSGVDGAGKSTLARGLVEVFDRIGVPSSVVWTRPGMRLGPLGFVAGLAKRVLGEGPEPGVRAVASGVGPAPRSRRGVLGWAWSMSVVLAFVSDAWKRHLRSGGVVIHDRHRMDALVTLDVLYDGVDLRIQQAIVARALPSAALSVYLDVTAEVAVARKPGDPIGAVAVGRQLDRYHARGACDDGSLVLDACRPTDGQVLAVLRALALPEERTGGG
jgi:hypothetical protein